MFVVVPIKFHIRGVNIAGIHYQIHMNRNLRKPWVELFHKFQTAKHGISSTLDFKISALYFF